MHVETSSSLGEILAAMAKAQGLIENPKKSASGQIGKDRSYKYADLVAIMIEWRKVAPAQGLSVVQIPSLDDQGRAQVTTILGHSSGEWIRGVTVGTPPEGNRGINGLQAAGSAYTYLRRYALAAMIGIVSEHDDDGRSSGEPTDQRGQVRPAAAAKQAQENGHHPDFVAAASQLAQDMGRLNPPLRLDGVSMYLEEAGKKRVSSMSGEEMTKLITWLRGGAAAKVDQWLVAQGHGDDRSLRHKKAIENTPAPTQEDPDAPF